MRLDEISVEMLQKALDVYVACAYEHSPQPVTVKSRVLLIRDFPGDSLADLLAHDVVERLPAQTNGADITSYGIRLGNDQYPHMKLMIQKVGDDDWRFVIDCHDGAFELEPTSPDKPRAEELKTYNQTLRERIESLWREADLPTLDEA